MPRKDPTSTVPTAQTQQDQVSEGIENYELPKSIVTKIAKSALPDNAKLQKETLLSLVKGSTVFINYLAAAAHDVAISKQHKSISASDVLKALENIDLGDMVAPLTTELQAYRDHAKGPNARRASTSVAASMTVPVKSKNVTTASRSKGKGKESASSVSVSASPMPSASALASLLDASESASAHGMAMDVDDVDYEMATVDEPMMEDEIVEEGTEAEIHDQRGQTEDTVEGNAVPEPIPAPQE